MRLVELSSSIKGFKTVKFKEGLNFIIGERTNPEVYNSKDSYNGVGKSLIIELIHFCLGSNKIKIFTEKIRDEIFVLTIKVNSNDISLKRICNDNQDLYINDELYKQKEFTDYLTKLIFPEVENVSGLSFRSLISRFIRRYKENYTKYYNFIKKEQEYNRLLANSYLLGLNTQIVEQKKELKESFTSMTNAKKSIKNDKMLKDYFTGKKDVKFHLTELKDKKEKLKNKLSNFKVAENYNNLQEQANEFSQQRNLLNNNKYLLTNKIKKIEKSLNKEIQLSLDDVKSVFQELNLIIPEKIKVSLEDVNDFHESMIINREKTLRKQKEKLSSELNEINQKIEESSLKLNELLKYLGKHGALEEYNSLTNQLSDIENSIKKIEDYNELVKKYEIELSENKKQKEDNKISVKEYLESTENHLDELMNIFRRYSKQFYENKTSGLSIRGNYKDNKISWDIHADIEGDSSDGINEVLIFCFDLTMFTANESIVNFIFHDSRLFSNMDPRQKYTLLKIVDDYVKENNIQYISSWNEDMIKSMKDIISDENYHFVTEIIRNNTILTLKDDHESNKLLGMQIDLPYDK